MMIFYFMWNSLFYNSDISDSLYKYTGLGISRLKEEFSQK